MPKKNKVVCVGWGLAGVYFDGISVHGNKFSTTTYAPSDYFLREVSRGHYENDDFSGAFVIDKSKVLEENSSHILRAAIFDPKLPARAVDQFVSRKLIRNGTLEDIASTLDSIGIELHVEYWRKLGARIGRFDSQGKNVIWVGQ